MSLERDVYTAAGITHSISRFLLSRKTQEYPTSNRMQLTKSLGRCTTETAAISREREDGDDDGQPLRQLPTSDLPNVRFRQDTVTWPAQELFPRQNIIGPLKPFKNARSVLAVLCLYGGKTSRVHAVVDETVCPVIGSFNLLVQLGRIEIRGAVIVSPIVEDSKQIGRFVANHFFVDLVKQNWHRELARVFWVSRAIHLA